MLGTIRGEVRFKEPLSLHTSLRLGGVADIFVVPLDVSDLRRALAFANGEDLPVTLLGDGSGLLVRDRGVRGVTIRLGGCLERVDFRGEDAIVGAGVRLLALVRTAITERLGGIEPFAAVPATVGGALATRARAGTVCFADVVQSVYLMQPDGTLDERKLAHGAGRSEWSPCPGTIIAGARVALHRRREADILHDVKRVMARRRREQPMALACAGGVWEEPPGVSASRLIATAGLRGKRVNGIEIAAKDPAFLINRGHARATDVLAAMELIRDRVMARHGVRLEPRLRVVGE